MNYALSVSSVVHMNLELVTLTEEPHGVRSQPVLEAALARPLHGFGGMEVFPTMPQKAAALLESIAQGHPFLQGNKRTAWLGAVTFLAVNNLGVEKVDDEESTALVLDVVEHKRDLQSVTLWFVDHLTF